MQIKTPKGNYYGDSDEHTYVLTTRDGRKIRQDTLKASQVKVTEFAIAAKLNSILMNAYGLFYC
jgi:hypothetical protein